MKFKFTAHFEWFAQEAARDPIRDGAAAALWIGDVALSRSFSADRLLYDLGSEWTDWTNLPFAFALWQTTLPAERYDELEPLMASFAASRASFRAQSAELAEHYAPLLRLEPERLARYWKTLRYELDPAMQEGLLHFYRLAHESGEAPRVERIAWASQKARA
jgi:chorismate dehydratase